MDDRMTVEQLAARAGMTVRNVREHQTRGLLPPPHLQGRKGYYDERHLARLQLIRELQDEGLNLQAIGWLLHQAPPEAAEEVARLKQALFAPWSTDEPRTYTVRELAERFDTLDTDVRERAEAVGLLRPTDAGGFEAPSPRLVETGAALVEMGIDAAAVLDVTEELLGHLDAVAERFYDLFLTRIWAPFDEAGRPAERWDEVRAALERLRPIAAEAVLSAFLLRMDHHGGQSLADRAPGLDATGPNGP